MQAAEEERRRHPKTEEFNVLGGAFALGKIPQSLQKRGHFWGKTLKNESKTSLYSDFYNKSKEREILSNNLLRFALL